MVLCQGRHEEEGGVQIYSDEAIKDKLRLKGIHLQHGRNHSKEYYCVQYCGIQDQRSVFSASFLQTRCSSQDLVGVCQSPKKGYEEVKPGVLITLPYCFKQQPSFKRSCPEWLESIEMVCNEILGNNKIKEDRLMKVSFWS
jgi:hypothetical protein